VKVISRRRSLFLAFLGSLFRVVFLKQSLRRIQVASNNVPKSHNASAKGLNNMPLTQKVSFKTMLQRGNRVQVPKVVRWQFKMESEQVLKVTVNALNVWSGWETFYARMDKSGRIAIPELMLKLLQDRTREKQSLTGAVMEVRLEPA
jgi:DNA-binding transcriptional regulator/RsmH inhibitor MraZ